MNYEKSIAIFGGGILQLSLIKKCNALNFKSIVIDPDHNAIGKKYAEVFEVIQGDDFEGTCEVIKKHRIDGILTSSTDKALVMMARIAEEFNLAFISKESALKCTDKFKMKQVFIENDIDCAAGTLISSSEEINEFPVIIKPLDNSGSRGVFYISDKKEAGHFYSKAKKHSNEKQLLCEEFIPGEEFSVEAIHYQNSHQIIQITKKITSALPHRVEMGHLAPAELSDDVIHRIGEIVKKIGDVFRFDYCASHTEIKIYENNIVVIETSPRLGGDFITSKLVPLSTGIDIEEICINMIIGREINIQPNRNNFSGIFYFQLPTGSISQILDLQEIKKEVGVVEVEFSLTKGDKITSIANSLERHGYFILCCKTRNDLILLEKRIHQLIRDRIIIKEDA